MAAHPRAATRLPTLLLALVLGACSAGGAQSGSARGAAAPLSCNRVASPLGNDRNSGTVRKPYLTFNRLADSLRPGMVGCLRAGAYGDRSTSQNVNHGGLPGRRVTITGYGDETPTVAGAVVISNGADYVTLSHVVIDGANDVLPGGQPQAMVVLGNHFVLEDSELTNDGSAASGILIKADNAVIRRDKIHDVGANQGYDHGIYVARSRDFTVVDNWIYDCRAGWGVQLYPNAVHGTVAHNVIDGCGSGVTVGGEDNELSSDNRIEFNLITNSTGLGRFNRGTAVAGCCGQSTDGNVVAHNVFWGNSGGNFDPYAGRSYAQEGNVSADPRYLNRGAKDFRVRARSAAKLELWSGTPPRRSIFPRTQPK